MAPHNSESFSEPSSEIKTTPSLSFIEKRDLQLAVMESYGLHHGKEHSENPKSMNWVDHGAAKAFQELLDEVDLSSEDIREVEQIKAYVRTGKMEDAVRHCHGLLSKIFAVEQSLELDEPPAK